MFICTCQPGSPIPFNTLHGNGEFIVRAPVGFEDGTGVVYSVLATLCPAIGYADIPGYELTFAVIEAQSDESHIRDFWDGSATRDLIPERSDRDHIMDVVCMAVDILIEEGSPGLVTFTTHSANLPSAALQKYYRVGDVLQAKGLSGGCADSYHGRHIWMFTK